MEEYPDPYQEHSNLKETLTKSRDVRYLSNFEGLLPSFSPSERLFLYVCTIALVGSVLFFLSGVNANASVEVPVDGGSLTEGVIGSARFINPLLAISEPDKDISTLVYSGLTRITPDGSIIPDLASSYQISEDGLTYTFTLRPNLTFHDGTPVTSKDVLYTVHAAQNTDMRSARRADWEGVTITAPDTQTIVFTLPRPYAPFLENTTLGIMPAHLWENVSSEEFPFSPLNVNPVGTGPYHVAKVDTDKNGVATIYELKSFNKFALGAPHLTTIRFKFFPNETALIDAWNAGDIDSLVGISPSELSRLNKPHVLEAALPRTFGVFFNQGHAPLLANTAVRSALDAAVDKERLVSSILGGFGVPLDGPIPPGTLRAGNGSTTVEELVETSYADNARNILTKDGWKFDEVEGIWKKGEQKLSFVLTTGDSPELTATAEALSGMWQAAGIHVEIHVYPVSELNTNIIRPRSYDAILFGEVVGRTLDLFAFWHSSQRNDPGLNLALYTNARADSLLAEARATTDRKERERLYESFSTMLKEDTPAVFLFAPELLYVLPENMQGVKLGSLVVPAERFLNMHEWYTETERVWSIFTNETE